MQWETVGFGDHSEAEHSDNTMVFVGIDMLDELGENYPKTIAPPTFCESELRDKYFAGRGSLHSQALLLQIGSGTYSGAIQRYIWESRFRRRVPFIWGSRLLATLLKRPGTRAIWRCCKNISTILCLMPRISPLITSS